LSGPEESSGNADAMRRSIGAYNAGDLDGLVAMAHPDIEWEVAPEHPASTTHRGVDAVVAYHEDWRNTLDDLRLDIQKITENGDSVVAVCSIRGKGSESGADVEVVIAFLTTFRDGQAIRVEEFLDPEEAMRALESPKDPPDEQ
jgi:ketosteroid isomerase-like protein